MRPELLQLAADLARRGERFALATVVRREPPSSAQAGDTALVTEGGTFHGWLGGSCTQPTVAREARRAIREGTPRLVALSPDPTDPSRPGVTTLPMTCHSGGRVDIYIEPVLPAPRLLVFGVSPTARALARIGKVLGYAVEAVDPEADVPSFPEADRVVTDLASPDLAQRAGSDPARLAAVVATLGVGDEAALACALALEPAYVGLVASRTRFAEVREGLLAGGVAQHAVERIKSPAGLDIGAVSPEEIALSVMAEIVQAARAATSGDADVRDGAETTVTIDPVCGMSVEPSVAAHRAEQGGQTVWFCGAGCREKFLAAPEAYLSVRETGEEAGA